MTGQAAAIPLSASVCSPSSRQVPDVYLRDGGQSVAVVLKALDQATVSLVPAVIPNSFMVVPHRDCAGRTATARRLHPSSRPAPHDGSCQRGQTRRAVHGIVHRGTQRQYRGEVTRILLRDLKRCHAAERVARRPFLDSTCPAQFQPYSLPKAPESVFGN